MREREQVWKQLCRVNETDDALILIGEILLDIRDLLVKTDDLLIDLYNRDADVKIESHDIYGTIE